ncbi:uncharacterized protein N7484_006475 [Penicillium longicatenatum]|uniref:uncharacterized protein n=1 Tax=Penicillium longicatenatum TaxID=1561947 RepID=UPI0025498382|nr:uncharacterized protein N7484_006475 [Penicillium longicatenatum]KAJ5643968.1 hypothetical protein N7484_006475 [Penicillium longicatenatum]
MFGSTIDFSSSGYNRCIVGDENEKDMVTGATDVFLMKKVDDDPFAPNTNDPFAPGQCDDDLEDCQNNKQKCQDGDQHDKEEVEVAGQKYKIYCDRHHNTNDPIIKATGIPFVEPMAKFAICSAVRSYTTVPGVMSTTTGDKDWKTGVKKV